MPRKTKDGQPFNQTQYVNEWAKENMATVSSRYKKEFVDEYKAALKILGWKQSDTIRGMMNYVIEEAQKKNQGN